MTEPRKDATQLTEAMSAYSGLCVTLPGPDGLLELARRIDDTGFWAVSACSPELFEVCLDVLREDPWERIRALREAISATPLLMAMDGRKLMGRRPFPDDVVTAFVRTAAEAGIRIFRVFHEHNDVSSIECALKAVREAGARAQGCIVYSESPDHTLESFVEASRKLEALGADTLCIMDGAGLLNPFDASRLVRMISEALGIPIHLHCGNRQGTASATYIMGLEAGASGFDSALSSFSGGAGLPPTEGLAEMLSGTGRETALDRGRLAEAAKAGSKILDGLPQGVPRVIGPSGTGDETGSAGVSPGPGLKELAGELGLGEVEDLLSFAFHPEAARSFFAHRERGDTPEEELAAVLGGVLARSVHIVPPPAGGGPPPKGNAWSMAGRLDSMSRRRGRRR